MKQMEPREIEAKLEAVVLELLQANAASIDIGRGLLGIGINAMIAVGGHDRAIAELYALERCLKPGGTGRIGLLTPDDIKRRDGA